MGEEAHLAAVQVVDVEIVAPILEGEVAAKAGGAGIGERRGCGRSSRFGRGRGQRRRSGLRLRFICLRFIRCCNSGCLSDCALGPALSVALAAAGATVVAKLSTMGSSSNGTLLSM